MLVVYHSLGRLLGRQLAHSSGDDLFQCVSPVPIDQLEMSEADRRTLRRAFFFEPLPSVHRHVFFSAPHRGSEEANSWTSTLAKSIIDFPKT